MTTTITESQTMHEEWFTSPEPTVGHSESDESSFRGDDEDLTTPVSPNELDHVQQIKGSCVKYAMETPDC
jgi:hypothetical protein